MTTSIVTPEIAAFARAVRAALSDLPAEEREELTDGLEADLAEAYAEDLRRELPDPEEYATELRDAAGLPKSELADDVGMLASVALAARRARSDLATAVRSNAALASVADFLGSIRPLWWVVRAWVAAWLVGAMIGSESGFTPGSYAMWLVLAIFVVISVQWGRGRWRFAGAGPVVVIGNLVAAVLLLPVAAMADSWTGDTMYVDSEPASSGTGLVSDGQAVRNVFAYDADGKPLSDVQLFDQDGRPLEVLLDPFTDECLDAECRSGYRQDGSVPQTARLVTGASALNVFPLSLIAGSVDDFGERQVDPSATAEPPVAPFAQVPAVDQLERPATTDKVAPNNE